MYQKLTNCKHCDISLESMNANKRANHSRWCYKNPRRSEYVNKNNGSQFRTPEVIAKRTLGIKKHMQMENTIMLTILEVKGINIPPPL